MKITKKKSIIMFTGPLSKELSMLLTPSIAISCQQHISENQKSKEGIIKGKGKNDQRGLCNTLLQ